MEKIKALFFLLFLPFAAVLLAQEPVGQVDSSQVRSSQTDSTQLLSAQSAPSQASSGQSSSAQRDSLVRLIEAGSARLIDKEGKILRKIEGSARFLHNDTYLLCDTAIWDVNTNIIDAIGHVQIIQDGTCLTGESLRYIVDQNLAQFRGSKVTLCDKENNTLCTHNLDYNTKDSVATFFGGGALRSKDNEIIESLDGTYDSKISLFVFYNSVELFSDSLFAKSTRIEYRSDLNKAYFGKGTIGWKGENMLSANGGDYSREREVMSFEDQAYLFSKEQEVWGDRIVYNRINGNAWLYGNAQVTDTVQSVIMFADKAIYEREPMKVILTENPAIAMYSEENGVRDTIFVSASDSIKYYTKKFAELDSASIAAAKARKGVMIIDPMAEVEKLRKERIQQARNAGKKGPNPRNTGLNTRSSDSDAQTGLNRNTRGRTLNSSTSGRTQGSRASINAAGHTPNLPDEPCPAELYHSDQPFAPIPYHPDQLFAPAPYHPDQPYLPEDLSLTADPIQPDFSQPADSLSLSAGADTLALPARADTLVLPAGADSLAFPAGVDTLALHPGADSLAFPAGADALALSAGADTLQQPTREVMQNGLDSLSAAADKVLEMQIMRDDTCTVTFVDAWHNIKLYGKDYQGVCDSMVYTGIDSIARLYVEPVLWSDAKNQFLSDSIFLQMRHDSLYKADFISNAFIATQEDTAYFNQIKSVEMMAYFKNNDIWRFDALGGASLIFYMEEDSTLTMINQKECKLLSALIKERKIQKIRYYDQLKSDVFPIYDLPINKQRLRGFKWLEERRPKNRMEVMPRQVCSSNRKRLLAEPMPEYPQTSLYFPETMQQIVELKESLYPQEE